MDYGHPNSTCYMKQFVMKDTIIIRLILLFFSYFGSKYVFFLFFDQKLIQPEN